MKGTFEVYYNKKQVKDMNAVEDFLCVTFNNREKDMSHGVTISTYSEDFADELVRLRDRLSGIDTFA